MVTLTFRYFAEKNLGTKVLKFRKVLELLLYQDCSTFLVDFTVGETNHNTTVHTITHLD